MSEQTETNPQRMIVIGLVVVAVLLAAIVGVLLYQQNQANSLAAVSAVPDTGTTGGTGTGTDTDAGTGAAPQVPAASTPVEFDVKTATKLPKGMTPEEAIKAYHEDVIAGKFEEAYGLLPLDKQQSYGDAKAYGDQVKAYGITSYEVGTTTNEGDTTKIAATQVTPQMPISYTWTFKKVDGQWYVESRTMGGQ